MLVTCRSTPRSLMKSSSAIARLVRPSAISAEHLALAVGQRIERPFLARASEHQRDDLGIEHRAAVADAPHRLDEPIDLGDPLLEQIADAVGVITDQ